MDGYNWGYSCCVQDRYENAAFASIGGLDSRQQPKRPQFVSDLAWPEFLRGYEAAAAEAWGPDWRTVPFGWRCALTINATAAKEKP